jgi:hypothetical protein
MEAQKSLNSKAILIIKNIVRGIIIPELKLYNRVKVTKTAWDWQRNRHVDQGNRTEISPHSYSHLIFDKVAKIYIGENTA